ncbi:MAG: hypothetical protein PWQ91_1498 [Eubacteriales bacterium]|nr:hypothetical protein [Eubacteriales bacterium]MDN5364436.1 hypothetical protein [Eubacteriales bacterium]
MSEITSHAVAREIQLKFNNPLRGERLIDDLKDLILKVADAISIRGIIPGHIKAFVVEGDFYSALNCTRPGKVEIEYSEDFATSELRAPQLSLVAVISLIPKEQVANVIDENVNMLMKKWQMKS